MSMVGKKIYTKKSRTAVMLLLYGILAVGGALLAASPELVRGAPTGAAGFMLAFGLGMFIMTLVKGRSPQVSIYAEHLEVRQLRKLQLVRYRNLVSIARPDANRLVLTIREEGYRSEVTVWLKELDPEEVSGLVSFLEAVRPGKK